MEEILVGTIVDHVNQSDQCRTSSIYNIPMAATANPNLQDSLNPPPPIEGGLSNAAHPMACIFTFLFKAAAFLVYFILGNFFSDVNTFIIVVLLSALDFWTVKNVTGRLLVGLRWWNDFDENGKEVWRFESFDQEFQANTIDKSFFWTSQYASTGTWAAFFVMKVLSFSIFWGLLVFINLSLSVINLYGFYKCSGQHNKKMDDLKKRMGQQGARMVFNNFVGGIFGGNK